MEYYGYIYKTTNLVNAKYYIGQRKGLFDPNYFGSGKVLRRAINKYGKENFRIEILDYAYSLEELDLKEIKHLGEQYKLPTCYNQVSGGKHSNIQRRAEKGYHLSEETKQKISRALKGKPSHNKGKPMPEEQKQKLSNALSGRPVSDEQKEQISKTLKKRYENGYINPQKGKTKYSIKEYRCVWCSKIFYRHCPPEKENNIKCCSRECQNKWRSSIGGKQSKKNDTNNWSEIAKKGWETRRALAER